ncbi:MAG: hypothetical protein HY720_03310 [Planctomycetes bacterium]|nr:hypothetical protein [Planctomycetota bacterium]
MSQPEFGSESFVSAEEVHIEEPRTGTETALVIFTTVSLLAAIVMLFIELKTNYGFWA